MPKTPATDTPTMLERVAEAVSEAEGADMRTDPARYRQIALDALKSVGLRRVPR